MPRKADAIVAVVPNAVWAKFEYHVLLLPEEPLGWHELQGLRLSDGGGSGGSGKEQVIAGDRLLKVRGWRRWRKQQRFVWRPIARHRAQVVNAGQVIDATVHALKR